MLMIIFIVVGVVLLLVFLYALMKISHLSDMQAGYDEGHVQHVTQDKGVE